VADPRRHRPSADTTMRRVRSSWSARDVHREPNLVTGYADELRRDSSSRENDRVRSGPAPRPLCAARYRWSRLRNDAIATPMTSMRLNMACAVLLVGCGTNGPEATSASGGSSGIADAGPGT